MILNLLRSVSRLSDRFSWRNAEIVAPAPGFAEWIMMVGGAM